jgi:hypothetical protein
LPSPPRLRSRAKRRNSGVIPERRPRVRAFRAARGQAPRRARNPFSRGLCS